MRAAPRRALYIVAFTLLCMLGVLILEFANFRKDQNQTAQVRSTETMQSLAADVGRLLSRIEAEGERLGRQFGSQDYSASAVEEIIRNAALEFPEVSGITACYVRGGFSEDRELYCPFFNKSSGKYVFVEQSYDYTIPGSGTQWFTEPVTNGAQWVEPYYGAAAKAWFLDYAVPFYWEDGPRKGEVRGIIDISLEASDFSDLMHDISVGRAGYAFMTTSEGTVLTHPVRDYIGTKNLQDFLDDNIGVLGLKGVYEAMLGGESGQLGFEDEAGGEDSFVVYKSIPPADYGLALVFSKADLVSGQLASNRRYINIGIVLSILIVVMLALYFGRDILDRREIEQLSVIATILLVANVLFLGSLTHGLNERANDIKRTPVVDLTSLGKFIDQERIRADTLKIQAPRIVPTGIFIDRMEFADSYNLNMSGHIWQKYPLDISDDVTVGFTLPQMSPFAESAYIEETHRKVIEAREGEEGYLLVGWEYRVTLRLDLSYADFPFDKRFVSVEIEPIAQTDNLLFVPDLGSYTYTSPGRKSGLSDRISLPGSNVTQTYFSFTTERYETDFGFNNKTAFEHVPTLHYNVQLKRRLLNSFVTYLIPIGVTISLIYILILACGKTEARQGIIESMAAFFFVLIFSHIDLRKDVVTGDLMFIEFFYFITYFMIIISTLNLITYTKDRTQIFDFHENQIFRACYFPLFFALLLAVMLVKFY